jgi:hypothetical protein
MSPLRNAIDDNIYASIVPSLQDLDALTLQLILEQRLKNISICFSYPKGLAIVNNSTNIIDVYISATSASTPADVCVYNRFFLPKVPPFFDLRWSNLQLLS